jgi:hypothetical protein
LNIPNFLLELPAILGLIGGVLFLLFYSRFPPSGRIIGFFVCFTAICEIVGTLEIFYHSNNLYILHIYTLGAFLFCGFFFHHLFRLLGWYHLKISYIIIGAVLIILNTLLFQWIDVFNSYSKTISQLIIIGFCILAYSLLTLKGYHNNDQSAIKFFIAAILISSTASISLYLFSHQIMALPQNTQETIWLINVVANIVTQLLFLWGLGKMATSNSTSSLE